MNRKIKKIDVIFGTRPEAVKLAPVIRALKADPGFRCRVCVTAQHRDMLDQALRTFHIRPDHDLDLMRPGQRLSDLAAKVVKGIDRYFKKEGLPDLVLVQGDTTTVFCAALAAFYNGVPVGHVEAGLRTHNIRSPWPEEANRAMTSRLAAVHFAPAEGSRQNLLREGIPANAIHVTGNTVIDALLQVAGRIKKNPGLRDSLSHLFPFLDGRRKIILVTGHRRENFGEGFENICKAIKKLGRRKDIQIVYPVHMNPNVKGPVNRILGGLPNIYLTGPLGYEPFVHLMMRSHIILTDSGGIQEEAPSLGKPVLVMRETTERPEAVEAGTVRLVGTDTGGIVAETERLLEDKAHYRAMAKSLNPYGDGKASGRIVRVLRGMRG